ncbi:MAG: hypothetical protein V7K38_13385 [Nostoc sp.]|uniref:hypothetical protein n=1 Tax=Nostoc sp. TaxID=1180 RepID=UPI002FFA1DF2
MPQVGVENTILKLAMPKQASLRLPKKGRVQFLLEEEKIFFALCHFLSEARAISGFDKLIRINQDLLVIVPDLMRLLRNNNHYFIIFS